MVAELVISSGRAAGLAGLLAYRGLVFMHVRLGLVVTALGLREPFIHTSCGLQVYGIPQAVPPRDLGFTENLNYFQLAIKGPQKFKSVPRGRFWPKKRAPFGRGGIWQAMTPS